MSSIRDSVLFGSMNKVDCITNKDNWQIKRINGEWKGINRRKKENIKSQSFISSPLFEMCTTKMPENNQ